MFTLIDLPYAPDALEPVISARTLEFHHGKHLAGYVTNLNKLIAGTAFEAMPLEEIVRTAPAGPLFNNAGQVLNHNLYFTQFKAFSVTPSAPVVIPSEAKESAVLPSAPTVIPSEAKESSLLRRIASQWGSLEAFQAEFEAKGAGLFGSGWVWLSADSAGALHITQEPAAGNPVTRGLRPLLTFDVWEHAYYLDWQNRRPDHLKALWSIIDWDVVSQRYEVG